MERVKIETVPFSNQSSTDKSSSDDYTLEKSNEAKIRKNRALKPMGFKRLPPQVRPLQQQQQQQQHVLNRNQMSNRTDGKNDHDAYLSYNASVAWLKSLADGKAMEMESIGKSVEGRDIW